MPGNVLPEQPKPHLLRRLGVRDAALIVMGGIVGSGIFVNPSVVARFVHTPFLIMLAWIDRRSHCDRRRRRLRRTRGAPPARRRRVCLLARCVSSGRRVLLRMDVTARFAKRRLGCGSGNVRVLSSRNHRSTLNTVQATIVGVIVLAIFTVINCLGVRESTSTQNAFMIAKIVAIGGVIVVGLFAAHATASMGAPIATRRFQSRSSRLGYRSCR